MLGNNGHMVLIFVVKSAAKNLNFFLKSVLEVTLTPLPNDFFSQLSPTQTPTIFCASDPNPDPKQFEKPAHPNTLALNPSPHNK